MLAEPEISQTQAITPLSDKEKVSAVVKAVVRIADAWKLTNAEAAALFDVPIATWNRMKSDSFKGNLDQDKMMRASLLIGLFKGLRLLFNGPLQLGWPKTPNKGDIFAGRSPIERMIDGGIPAMITARRHIDALRGGI